MRPNLTRALDYVALDDLHALLAACPTQPARTDLRAETIAAVEAVIEACRPSAHEALEIRMRLEPLRAALRSTP